MKKSNKLLNKKSQAEVIWIVIGIIAVIALIIILSESNLSLNVTNTANKICNLRIDNSALDLLWNDILCLSVPVFASEVASLPLILYLIDFTLIYIIVFLAVGTVPLFKSSNNKSLGTLISLAVTLFALIFTPVPVWIITFLSGLFSISFVAGFVLIAVLVASLFYENSNKIPGKFMKAYSDSVSSTNQARKELAETKRESIYMRKQIYNLKTQEKNINAIDKTIKSIIDIEGDEIEQIGKIKAALKKLTTIIFNFNRIPLDDQESKEKYAKEIVDSFDLIKDNIFSLIKKHKIENDHEQIILKLNDSITQQRESMNSILNRINYLLRYDFKNSKKQYSREKIEQITKKITNMRKKVYVIESNIEEHIRKIDLLKKELNINKDDNLINTIKKSLEQYFKEVNQGRLPTQEQLNMILARLNELESVMKHEKNLISESLQAVNELDKQYDLLKHIYLSDYKDVIKELDINEEIFDKD